MLNRQRAVLFMLHAAERPVSRMELVKWCFLVSHETPSGGGTAFYEFLPYQMGPFSFCLYREADKLAQRGLLREADTLTWEMTAKTGAAITSLPVAVRDDLSSVVDRFKHASVDNLLDYVYKKFPWFTINSKREKRQSRPVAAPAIYTAGYEGQHVDGFLNGLLCAGLKRVIDVRHNPISRQYGYHKTTLMKLCGKVGLDYNHVPSLGIPSDLRRGERFASRGELLRHYEEEILPSCGPAITELAEVMTSTTAALICMEAAPADCHRSRLAGALAEAAELPICHLGRGECATSTSQPEF